MTDSAQPANDSHLSRALDRFDRRLSRDLRALRQARSLTLQQISDSIGRSVGWLSQVERGISMPTLADLRRMADTFGVPFSLFDRYGHAETGDEDIIVRAGAGRTIGTVEGVEEELLSPSLGGTFQMRRRCFAPGAALDVDMRRDAEEAGHVLAGSLVLEIDGVVHQLGAGDSFRVKGRRVSWRNASTEPATTVWVLSPPVY